MSVLSPFLAFDPTETPVSYATRLASFHIGVSLSPFLSDIGIRPTELLSCELDAVQRLAEVTGVESACLLRNSAVRVAKRRFNLRDNLLTSEFFSSPETVFCPACLRADDDGATEIASARLGRLEWTLRPVRSCPVHGLALVRRKKQGSAELFRQFALVVPECGGELDRMIDNAEQQSTSQLQIYVVERLDGLAGPAWLDSQTLEQAVRVTEMLGARIQFGPSKKPANMTPAEWDIAGHVGYQVTSGGEPAIRDALAQMQLECRGKGAKPGFRANFGLFHDWLSSKKNRKDAGDITRILREHIFENIALPAGAKILGEVLPERRLHSVASLASETGIHPQTLRNVLAAKGLVPVEDKVSGHHVFDASAGREVSLAVHRSTKPNSLPKALNCTRPQAIQLVDEGLLDPIADGRREAAGRTRKAIYDRDIARFLERLHARARVVGEVPVGMVSIAKAAEKVKMTCIEVLHLVLGGFAQNVIRLVGIEGYAAIYVDPIELRARKAMHLPGMSASDAFGKLKIPKSSGWDLAKRQAEPRLQPIVVEGTDGRHRYFRFDEQCVDSFASQYTTQPRVANANEIEVKVVHAGLKRKGIKPVLGKIDIGIDLYRVADIPNFETS